MATLPHLDSINKAIWSGRAVQRELDRTHGFVDPGERAALDHVKASVEGKPVLDLGVGTGRTIPLYRGLSDDYRAADYLPEMVATCRKAHPGVSVDLADARDLVRYPEAHFGLVNFSYNGIDAVSHEDRRLVFRAVRRVLRPDGVFLFSTLNLLGPSYRDRPWHWRLWGSRTPHRVALAVVRQAVGFPGSLLHWVQRGRLREIGDGYAHAPISAHGYALLVHYTTLARQLDELAQSGFDPTSAVFDSVRGERVGPDTDTSHVDWFTIAARLAPRAS